MLGDSIIDIRNVSKVYQTNVSLFKRKKINALHNVSLSIPRGSTLALIGESGSGKSTLAKVIMRLEDLTSGDILIDYQSTKKNITQMESKEYYGRVQMIFQDPYGSLNPHKQIWQIISAPIAAHYSYNKSELFSIAKKYSQLVGLGHDCLLSYPFALSGGQRQRVGIARALVVEPELLILDSALSALDLSIQAQIINRLIDLQEQLELTYLFISHDIPLIKHLADQVAVMYSGEIVEFGSVSKIFNASSHAYGSQQGGKG